MCTYIYGRHMVLCKEHKRRISRSLPLSAASVLALSSSWPKLATVNTVSFVLELLHILLRWSLGKFGKPKHYF